MTFLNKMRCLVNTAYRFCVEEWQLVAFCIAMIIIAAMPVILGMSVWWLLLSVPVTALLGLFLTIMIIYYTNGFR